MAGLVHKLQTTFVCSMKAVILAGGLGTRISEETGNRPKPMVEVGGKPILWHILKIYRAPRKIPTPIALVRI
jgi:NDP-sugar pyrophosphorylase family protein